MTQREVSEKLGVVEVCVSRWERNKSRPSIANLRALAKLYGRPLDSLASLAEEKRERS